MSQDHKASATSRTIRAVWVDDDNFYLKWLLPEMYKIAGKHLIIKEFNASTPALIQIRHSPPDIVLTNLIMPQPDGIEFIRLIREFNKQIPIVVVSARFNPKILQDVRNAGANSFFFKKDMNLNILSAKIDILTADKNHPAVR